MKSEHRHELAENDLSKLLARWGTEFDKHANTVLSALIVVALVAAAVIWWTRSSAATSAAGWTELSAISFGNYDNETQMAQAYQGLAQDYTGSQVAHWATLRAADAYLREGIRQSLTSRAASDEHLAQAKESYDSLLQDLNTPGVIREQALLGNAVTLEATSDGSDEDTNTVIAAYEKLLEDFSDTRFKAYAVARIEELSSTNAKDFYAWFHQLNPTPPDRPGPQDQQGSSIPGDLSNLELDLGAGSLPLTLGDTPAATDEGANPFAAEEMKDKEAPADTNTAEPDESPAAEKKQAAQPDSDKPADEAASESKPDDAAKSDKPADEAADAEDKKPAAEEPAPADKDTSDEAPAETDKPAAEADAASE